MKSKNKLLKTILIFSFLILFIFTFSSISLASPNQTSNKLKATNATDSSKFKGREKLKERLGEVKLKICEKKEANIKKRANKLVQRAEKIQNIFGRIIQKTDKFYVDKLVPADLEIDNYEGILNNLENKRKDVATAIAAAEDTADNFDCEGQNPKEQITQFRTNMKGVISALNEYKKAVINYLVTVRTKAKNYKAQTATSSAEPATGSVDLE